MVSFTVILSGILIPPVERQMSTAITGIAAMFGVANFAISYGTGNYFAAPTSANPLLHTWSLSVEEQFYLAFPVIFFLALKFADQPTYRRMLSSIFVVFALLSSAFAMSGFFGWVGYRGAGVLTGF